MNSIKPFWLQRNADESGVSGIGVVAVGAQYPSGRCIMEWIVNTPSLVIYDTIDELIKIHGHNGKTVVNWGNCLYK